MQRTRAVFCDWFDMTILLKVCIIQGTALLPPIPCSLGFLPTLPTAKDGSSDLFDALKVDQLNRWLTARLDKLTARVSAVSWSAI